MPVGTYLPNLLTPEGLPRVHYLKYLRVRNPLGTTTPRSRTLLVHPTKSTEVKPDLTR